MTTYEIIIRIIKDSLCLQEDYPFRGETTFNELELDSLDVAEIIMSIEDEFDIEIRDEELEGITSLAELTQLVSSKSE